jgi:hypothetical protein
MIPFPYFLDERIGPSEGKEILKVVRLVCGGSDLLNLIRNYGN